MSAPVTPNTVTKISTRYRCRNCGNLTRFHVVRTTRTKSFEHYDLGGNLIDKEVDIISDHIVNVVCDWCDDSKGIEEIDILT